jgi:hypothetical protein
MNDTPAPLRVSATSSFGRSGAVASRSRSAAANAPMSLPSQRAVAQPNARALASRSPSGETCSTHVSDWILFDDRGDLAHALGGGRGQRLPELPLLQLAVARQHVDPAAAAAQPPGADEALRLGDAHAQRAGARVDLRHRRDVGVAGQAAEAAQAVDEVEVDAAHSGEHRVHRRRVVALGGERHVVVAEDLEVQPREHVEAAEARAEVARARAHDHRQDVQAACVGERGRPRDRVGVERADAPELARRDVVDGDAVGAVGAPFPHGQTSSGSWWMYSVLRSE